MSTSPPKAAQAIVALLIPGACREEVLGDLQERSASRAQYFGDALSTVPLVILSRIRRTSDPQLLLMCAFVLYLSFYGAAWFRNPSLLYEPWALVYIAIPGAVALLAIGLEDAYARSGHRSPLRLIRGPLLGAVWTILCQCALWSSHSRLALPLWTVLYGSAMALLLTSGLRILFAPPSTRQGPI